MTPVRNRLLLVIPLVLILVVAYFVVDVNQAGRAQVIARFNTYQTLRAQITAHEVETYLDASAHTLLHVARLAAAPDGNPGRLQDAIENFSTSGPGLPPSAITAVDPTGKVMYSTSHAAPGVEFATPTILAWARQPENRGRILIASQQRSEPTRPGGRSGEGLFMATPLWRASSPPAPLGHRWLGLLVRPLDLASLLSGRLSLASTPEQSSHAWIMDQDGTVLFQSEHPEMSHLNVRRNNASCLRCHGSFDYVEQALAARSGTTDYRLTDGPVKLAAVAPITYANASWVIVVNSPRDQVTGFLRRNLSELLVLVGLLALVFLSLSWHLIRSADLRRLAEAEVERLHRKVRLLLDSVTEGVIGLDTAGRHTFVNPAAARMLGFRADDLLGRASHALWHHTRKDGQMYASSACPIYAAYSDGTVHHSAEDVFWRRDGTPLDVDYTSTPIVEQQRVTGAVVTFRDISEKRRIERQLRQGQKLEAIGTLAGGIAHDFNNILGAIIGNTELLMDEIAADHPAQESIRQIFNATHRATDLVRQILTFSRQTERERLSIRVSSVAKEALKLLRATLPATIAIHTDIDDGAPPILADPTQVYQVLMNLVANAAHAMRDRCGDLTVRVHQFAVDAALARQQAELHEGVYVRLSVSDTGHGIDPGVLDRMFEPFFTTKQPGEGTGLGLAVAHGIVASHGGAIIAHTEPGAGTTFDVYFPVTEVRVSDDVTPTPIPRGHGQRILYVDDEPALGQIVTRELQALGYQVDTDTHPEAALERFAAAPTAYDLVITDLAMPGLSGRQLASRMLRLRPTQPILLVTGFSGALPADTLQHLALRAVLHKPLNAATLGRAVSEALRQEVASSGAG